MAIDELFVRRVVVCGSALVYWAGVWVVARRVRRHIGHSPNLKPRTTKERLLWVGWMLVVLGWVGQPFVAGSKGAFGVFRFMSLPHPYVVLIVGTALVVAGYAGTLWCYAAMGDAWRIGVNQKEKTSLVFVGPYRFVRHPIYGFQVVMLAGAALLLPTAISFAMLGLHLICTLIKAVDEENYLKTVHGQAYADYMSRTGRLIPRLIRPKSPGI